MTVSARLDSGGERSLFTNTYRLYCKKFSVDDVSKYRTFRFIPGDYFRLSLPFDSTYKKCRTTPITTPIYLAIGKFDN